MIERITRWTSLVCATTAVSWALKLAVQMSISGFLGTLAVALVTTLYFRSLLATLTVLIGAVAATVVALRVVEIATRQPVTPLSDTATAVLYCTMLVGVALICRGLKSGLPSITESLAAIWITCFSFWFSVGIPHSADGALQLLASSGEDSAAWLEALGKSTSATGTVLTSQSSYGGGFGSGVGLVLLRTLHFTTSNIYSGGVSTNSVILVRSLFLVGVLSAVLATCGALRLLASSSRFVRCVTAVSAGLMAYTMSIGMSAFGHFSASFAGLLILSGVIAASVARDSQGFPGYGIAFLVTCTFIVGGLSWYPLLLCAFGMTVVILLFAVFEYIKRWRVSRHRLAAFLPLILVIPAAYIVRRLFATVITNLNWDYFSFNNSLGGGVQPISGWLAFTSLVSLLVVGFSAWSNLKTVSIGVFTSLLAAGMIVGYTACLYILSYIASPYGPQYGALKLLYVGSMISAPFIPVAFGRLLQGRRAPVPVQLAIGPLVILGLALIDPGRMLFSWPKAVKPVAPWSAAVVEELRIEPSRKLVCLNTSLDTSQNYGGYLCTRMANGLQAKSNYEYNTWTAANIGQIPPAQAAEAWDLDFFKNLTILLFDPTRLNNGEQQQIDWLSTVRWRAVKLIGPNGELIKEPGVPLSSLAQPLSR